MDKEDIKNHFMDLAARVRKDMEDEAIRDMDKSRLNQAYIQSMLRTIGHAEFELDVLLTYTEEVGGFGSSYPKKCLECLKLFRTILEMELK